jgi:putative ABC transport system permease protein
MARIEHTGEAHELALSAPVSRFAVPLRNLLRRPGRSIMTGAAVSISMALLISMFSVSEGLVESTEAPLLESREDLVVQPDQGMIEGAHAMAEEMASWDEVDFATPALYHDLRVMLPPKDAGYPRRPKTLQAFGVVPYEFWNMMGRAERERFDPDFWFQELWDPHYSEGAYNGTFSGEILLSKNLRGEGIHEGDTLPVLALEGEVVNMTVVGFFDHEFSGLGYFGELSFALLHLSELQTLTGLAVETDVNGSRLVDLADGMSVALTPEAVREGAEKRVAQRIKETYPAYSEDVFTKEDQLELIRQETQLAELFYIAVGSVSLFIGLLFVATIMIVSVLERTREIGMLRAIGISRRTVFLQILSESMVLVLAGALIGIPFGYYGAVWAADQISSDIGVDIELGFSLTFVVRALIWVLVVGALFAMYPARIAVRMNIVRAITSGH